MTWTPSRIALVTAVGIVALAALGGSYLGATDQHETTLGASAVGRSSAGSSSRATATVPAQTAAPQPTIRPAVGTTATSAPSSPLPPPRHGPRQPPSAPSPSSPPEPTTVPRLTPPRTLDFVLSSFNVLGASHTSGSGKRPGMASGRARAVGAAELIRRHGADVVGFQELQGSQLAALQRLTNLDFYPGSSLRRQDSENSIGWRRDEWVAVEKHTVRIPYFDGGPRAMPFVKLRSLGSGLEAWFANFHNPAETAQFHHQQRYRTRATEIEIRLANRLVTTTHLPVFVTGDMNERSSYFCRFTAGTPMVAARGGSHNGRCLAGRPRAVDWIFGSRGVDFTGYYEDRSHLVDVTTDHPVVVARVHVVGPTLDD